MKPIALRLYRGPLVLWPSEPDYNLDLRPRPSWREKLRCFFGHAWGEPQNIRYMRPDYWTCRRLITLPISVFLRLPRECDRTCRRCGKTQTFHHDDPGRRIRPK